MITKEDLYNSYYNLKTKLNLSKNINRYLDKCIDYITNDILFAIKNNTLEILLNLKYIIIHFQKYLMNHL